MKTSTRSSLIAKVALVALIAACILLGSQVGAENAIGFTSTGQPFKWSTFPITYTVDGGALGSFTNAQANALVASAFGAWTTSNVPTSAVTVSQNATVGLPGPGGDVTTVAQYGALGCAGLNP